MNGPMQNSIDEIVRQGADDAANWRAARTKNFLTVSEQLAYRSGYDSVAGNRADKRILSHADTAGLAYPHQRSGSQSNAEAGRALEQVAKSFFASQGIDLQIGHTLLLGHGARKKGRAFDLGCDRQKVLVECKSLKWRHGGNVPSAKISVLNEAMFYFHLAPEEYRKILFMLHHKCDRRGVTLAEYYLATYGHLIPSNVEFFEYDEEKRAVKALNRA